MHTPSVPLSVCVCLCERVRQMTWLFGLGTFETHDATPTEESVWFLPLSFFVYIYIFLALKFRIFRNHVTNLASECLNTETTWLWKMIHMTARWNIVMELSLGSLVNNSRY